MPERMIGAWFVRTNPARLRMEIDMEKTNGNIVFPERPLARDSTPTEKSASLRQMADKTTADLAKWMQEMYSEQMEHGEITGEEYEQLISVNDPTIQIEV